MRYHLPFVGAGLVLAGLVAIGAQSAQAGPRKAGTSAAHRAAFAGTPYRHPLGFTLTYPAGWRVEKGEGASLQLVAGNPDPLELYFVTADSAQGIVRTDDPRLIDSVGNDLRQLFPFLEPSGEPAPIATRLGPGVRLTWEGRSPTDVDLRAEVYVALRGGDAVSLVAVAQRDRLAARAPVLRQVFASFSADGPATGGSRTTVVSRARSVSPVRYRAVARSRQSRGRSGAGNETPLAREWRQRLSGKRLTRMSSYSSGSSGGYNSRSDLYLDPSGTYTYQSSSSVSVYVPGATGSSVGQNASTGRWRVFTRGGRAILEVSPNGGTLQQSVLEYVDGKTFLNGSRVFVTVP